MRGHFRGAGKAGATNYHPEGHKWPLGHMFEIPDLEAKSGAGVPKAVCVILPTPATLLEPVVLALAFPLDHFSNVERGDLLLG